ncbi:hypothetical protein [Lactobacillus intestinalis]|uniref:hypothetical protein n=1 Tax=Lactobacillus intestinalis TaxID=151781 RepID=UPI0026094297|nr:hypothetical protein [Lactobacillus intestinalis]
MADIKFMDISENDNPATTDSILVGNKENGLKRTTVGKLGDMFAVHGLFHYENVYATLTDPKTQSYNIVAPDVEGYTFAFWLSSASNGSTFSSYVEHPLNKQTKVWIPLDVVQLPYFANYINGNTRIELAAVYIKNSVA